MRAISTFAAIFAATTPKPIWRRKPCNGPALHVFGTFETSTEKASMEGKSIYIDITDKLQAIAGTRKDIRSRNYTIKQVQY